jgi:hypothetical protein
MATSRKWSEAEVRLALGFLANRFDQQGRPVPVSHKELVQIMHPSAEIQRLGYRGLRADEIDASGYSFEHEEVEQALRTLTKNDNLQIPTTAEIDQTKLANTAVDAIHMGANEGYAYAQQEQETERVLNDMGVYFDPYGQPIDEYGAPINLEGLPYADPIPEHNPYEAVYSPEYQAQALEPFGRNAPPPAQSAPPVTPAPAPATESNSSEGKRAPEPGIPAGASYEDAIDKYASAFDNADSGNVEV